VVVIAEFFVAQAGAAAAVAVGEDVAALETFWCFGSCVGDGVWHVPPHWVKSVQSIQKKRPELVLRVRSFALAVKCESPAGLPGFFFLSTSILSNRGKLKCHFRQEYFSDCKVFIHIWLSIFGDLIPWFWGLTCEFTEVFEGWEVQVTDSACF
jgi:hypothetical protein